MKKVLALYIPLILLVAISLLFRHEILSPVFAIAILLSIAPLLADIINTFRHKRMDLGLPVVVTIVVLIVLKDLSYAAIFVLLILAGRLFKEYILWRVRESVASISKALPAFAFVKSYGEIKQIHISAVQKGDMVVVKGGGRVPVDGFLMSDAASLDESVITGEAKPVVKKAGDHLVAASINLSDYIELRASDTSANSTITQMQRLVEEAQSRNAPLSRFTTLYAEITSLVALVAVVIVLSITKNIKQALALWIALVPVIFAIIVPVASTIGISILARLGVLVKTAEALENLTQVDTLCFDKTGTLTRGKPEISHIVATGRMSENDLLRIVGSVERFSEHSLGEPIVREVENRKLPWLDVKQIQVVKGRGISALVNGDTILIGNREYIQSAGVQIDESYTTDAKSREDNGATAIWIAENNDLAGLIFLTDQPRDETKPTLARLHELNYSLVMLTGDHHRVAQKIGAAVGVTEVRAGLLPQDKINSIKQFKSRGKHVLMVGDGINDAPALAEANVGVAMGLRGVGITLESAQVVLVHDNLAVLPQILSIAKQTFKIIEFDLILATSIHLVAAILVIFGVIGILGSTVFHQVSSTLVLLNTLRLFSVNARSR